MKNALSADLNQKLDDNHKRIRETNDLLDRIENRLKMQSSAVHGSYSPERGHAEESQKLYYQNKVEPQPAADQFTARSSPEDVQMHDYQANYAENNDNILKIMDGQHRMVQNIDTKQYHDL